MRGKIGNRTIAEMKPGERDMFLWDVGLAGFGMKLTPAGKRTYLVQFRLGGRGGRTRRVTIGRHGSPWTPATARVAARRLLAEIATGRDPGEARRTARRELTVAALCDLYRAEGCATKKPSTLATDRGCIERHIKPLLGKKKVNSVRRGDVERFLQDVANGKTAADVKTGLHGRSIVRGGKGTATRTLGLLGAIFTFAVDRGLREDNPVRGVKRWPGRRMNRFLSAAELARLGESLREAELEGVNPFAIAALRLLALSGCRKGEILGLRWAEVDLEHACLRLDDAKAGARVVRLGAPALQVLAPLPRLEGNPHVFPSSGRTRHIVNLKLTWKRIRARAGLEGVRIHDLRHTAASVAASGGVGLVLIGGLLGHKVPATTARYAHLSDDPLRAAANVVQDSIAAAMNAGQGTGAEVVELDRARQGDNKARRREGTK